MPVFRGRVLLLSNFLGKVVIIFMLGIWGRGLWGGRGMSKESLGSNGLSSWFLFIYLCIACMFITLQSRGFDILPPYFKIGLYSTAFPSFIQTETKLSAQTCREHTAWNRGGWQLKGNSLRLTISHSLLNLPRRLQKAVHVLVPWVTTHSSPGTTLIHTGWGIFKVSKHLGKRKIFIHFIKCIIFK